MSYILSVLPTDRAASQFCFPGPDVHCDCSALRRVSQSDPHSLDVRAPVHFLQVSETQNALESQQMFGGTIISLESFINPCASCIQSLRTSTSAARTVNYLGVVDNDDHACRKTSYKHYCENNIFHMHKAVHRKLLWFLFSLLPHAVVPVNSHH